MGKVFCYEKAYFSFECGNNTAFFILYLRFSSFAKTTKTEWERPRPRDLLSFVNSKPSDNVSIELVSVGGDDYHTYSETKISGKQQELNSQKLLSSVENTEASDKTTQIGKDKPKEINYNKITIPFVASGMVICLIVIVIIGKKKRR